MHSKIERILRIGTEDEYIGRVLLFTNGMFESALVPALSHPKIYLAVNCNAPCDYPRKWWDLLCENLERLAAGGAKIMLSYNIYRIDFDYSFILDLADEYSVAKIRYALAKPSISGENDHIRYEEHGIIAARLMEFLMACFDRGKEVDMDCTVHGRVDWESLSERYPSHRKTNGSGGEKTSTNERSRKVVHKYLPRPRFGINLFSAALNCLKCLIRQKARRTRISETLRSVFFM